MKKTNFDRYLAEQIETLASATRFEQAGEAWDVALQLAALREQVGLSQAELTRKLKTTQQQISRLESPGYEGHSLTMLRRLAKALCARVRVVLEPDSAGKADALAEDPVPYCVRCGGRIKNAEGRNGFAEANEELCSVHVPNVRSAS